MVGKGSSRRRHFPPINRPHNGFNPFLIQERFMYSCQLTYYYLLSSRPPAFVGIKIFVLYSSRGKSLSTCLYFIIIFRIIVYYSKDFSSSYIFRFLLGTIRLRKLQRNYICIYCVMCRYSTHTHSLM